MREEGGGGVLRGFVEEMRGEEKVKETKCL